MLTVRGGSDVAETVAVVDSRRTPPRLRLADLVAALSLGIDLGFGQPMEHVLRQCLIALRLGDLVGLTEEQRSTTYYTALLVNVGCHTDAHEQAKWFGDDIACKSGKYKHDLRSLASNLSALRMLGAGHQPVHRVRVGLDFFLHGHKDLDGMVEQHAQLAHRLAGDIGLPPVVQNAVAAAYERWDGRGWPGELSGDAIPIESRVTQIAEFVEVAHRLGGIDGARRLAEQRSGGQFDPVLAQLLIDNAEPVLDRLAQTRAWDEVIDTEPALRVMLTQDQADAALTGIADFIDLKSPYTLGHSRAVADLASEAARTMGLGTSDLQLVRRSALVQGFGRLGVSNAIWDKPGPLGAAQWERVRMHPYLTERMLCQSDWLAPLGAVAVQLRERLDGSGYPRGLSGGAISTPARVLAAADVYRSMTEPRPHRAARSPEDAAGELRQEVRAKRLDGDAAEAVLAAAGHIAMRRREYPAGLTAREVDVLRLLARGLSSRQISAQLVISPKTARNHIEHIYAKIGATSRVTASLFAIQHGLLPDQAAALDA
jgi:HD-GYP domain-containing protein (c-di-GMP phosphodiesterase class II)